MAEERQSMNVRASGYEGCDIDDRLFLLVCQLGTQHVGHLYESDMNIKWPTQLDKRTDLLST